MPYEPVLLARIGKPNSAKLEGYRADGGYATFERALKEMQPAQVIDQVKNSGLRGRGGAGFPTGLKWTFLPKDHPGPIYLCINADESEPCTYNNRILMEKDPHQVIEGIMLACYAIKSRCAYFYVRYEYGDSYRSMQAAIDELYAAKLLGKNINGSGFDLDIVMHRGAGAYICGEETGLIESLEGKRAWPRIKPPFPAVEGAFRKPTIVNNVETMACVTQIMKRGVDWFKSLGVPPDPKNPRDAGSYGPKLYTLAGHVEKPVCVELPMGVTLRDLVEKHGGGVWKGRKAKAVNPGGLSMGFVDVNAPLKGSDGQTEYDIPLDFNGPGRVGCLGLGTAAVTVVDDQTSMVDVLHNVCQFFSHESCGQCTPCREGTGWMLKIVDRLRRGQGRKEDLDVLIDVADRIGIMPGTTICGLSDGAGWPVKTAIRKFRAEFEAAIKSGAKSQYAKSLDVVGAH
ncbi:nadh dehydrogenase : NADH-quinone oxidoreductase, F subunit OS=Planctomyces limnophilus (strain ATCC 43296 / DSM 3776 / IFAM 1008 / 290) GN=Plim_3862 PE=4 SV=1: Complex1_51K: SLBB: NADH_4Fe-4S [Gemmataceae bacterium]|nr:nadh dehydrogenase : NADH-quinone oxidoreductase, F subunit OS=Planctomyces limnophilus (strain ATCC 43296 / DSM 3776 / IFAM 1008 / 290) GN=Plim_3862 PE=4 SV=1: Complex1_51K: SLBB: NADH_4Fe-4S [Gemmataceae bacterium]VTT97227.1 nadh dehydrogenase : NADH-quinone oxidoreductase, F subunit OS=Planctomyces limnophilus (strain ATCC 43296 / DSM 3776 / IFAM 1008 / 290) GN=Plim_3862 PE=4 SV=1: Complex1_51K: SLBB: NADH_4Fe-4S [Gemmataceae bacterium]